MLFNSFGFIFIFLPLALAAWAVLNRLRLFRFAIPYLILLTLIFYGYNNPSHLPLLCLSILFNFFAGKWIHAAQGARRKQMLALGAGVNIAVLFVCKYTGMTIDTINALSSAALPMISLALPLGISFYSFLQIAYLADIYKGGAPQTSLMRYAAFAGFFPHLSSGPISRYANLMPGLQELEEGKAALAPFFAEGLTLFSIGLFKKVVIADSLALHASPVFDAAARGYDPTFLEAWAGAISYTFQLYFDFSGYTDMALGIALLFGIRLPHNFDAPYRSLSLVDFWRRWHITLSLFLRDYVYIPLGGNRRGKFRARLNIMITMLLGGLWHGANWTFVLWGGLHGLFLAINHVWNEKHGAFALPRFVAWCLTLIVVTLLWVLFRAQDMHAALGMYQGLFGLNGLAVPAWIGLDLPSDLKFFQTTGFVFWNGLAALIIFLLPQTSRLFPDGLYNAGRPPILGDLRFAPGIAWCLSSAFLLVAALSVLQRNSSFLYFQF